jgi:hypothetical protein
VFGCTFGCAKEIALVVSTAKTIAKNTACVGRVRLSFTLTPDYLTPLIRLLSLLKAFLHAL